MDHTSWCDGPKNLQHMQPNDHPHMWLDGNNINYLPISTHALVILSNILCNINVVEIWSQLLSATSHILLYRRNGGLQNKQQKNWDFFYNYNYYVYNLTYSHNNTYSYTNAMV